MSETSAFGVVHKAATKDDNREAKIAGGVAAGAGVGAGSQVKMREHNHYTKKTRKYIQSLPAGEHDVPIKMLKKNPRKLGARKNQVGYVAAMAKERPKETYPPVPVTRYKDGVIQRDNAHSVMAHAMNGEKTVRIKVEDANGYRPSRRAVDELVRRSQAKYQNRRIKRYSKLSPKEIDRHVSGYTKKQRKQNEHKRPRGVVEETFKASQKAWGAKRAFGIAKADNRNRDKVAGGLVAAGGATALATPVRRSGEKVKIKGNEIKSKDAKKILNPGYRPGNKRSIKVMARNLGHLENQPTRVIQYSDGTVIPWDGNHRGTARVVRGDKSIPVSVTRGGERPTSNIPTEAYRKITQKIHAKRVDRGAFDPSTKGGQKGYTGKHAGQSRAYGKIANGSAKRGGARVRVDSETIKVASGPSKAVLRAKQVGVLGTGAALAGTGIHLGRKDKVTKRDVSQKEIDTRKKIQATTSRVGGTLGLTSLGAFIASTKGRPTGMKFIPVATAKRRKLASKIALGTSTSGAAIGGAGAFNFASYTAAEAKQKKKPVIRS